MRKPRYSHEAFRTDSRGREHSLWDSVPGVASEFIHHLPDLLKRKRRPIVLYCRVSSEKQERQGNLVHQKDWAIGQLLEMGFSPGPDLLIFDGVESSRVQDPRLLLNEAIDEARRRGAILVAGYRDRFIRWRHEFENSTRNQLPLIGEYMGLRKMAGDVPFATIYPPDGPLARSDQIKRGQRAKGNRGGRPPKGDQRALLKRVWWKWRTLPSD